ncbi:hypothetical protein BN1080_02639 [Planococcus massiliensis]|uniref:Uncharacterized protein n=1 Tax=Planococcus massiliensis TaxID=1499687 RepID=A0A098EPA1_9BACL|nr:MULTISPECIES: hypothetical protein [Planococcus]MCJ1910157.1 hypothetical protein [Planococcus ruber]CEG23635.1 hypothetical protein BN1080_02639 [Planococcus massiliensis]
MKSSKKFWTAIAVAGLISVLAVAPVFGETLPVNVNLDAEISPLSAPHILPPL